MNEQMKIKKVGLLPDLNLCVIFANGEDRYFRLTETKNWPECMIQVEDEKLTVENTEFSAEFVYSRSNENYIAFSKNRPQILIAFDENGLLEDENFFE